MGKSDDRHNGSPHRSVHLSDEGIDFVWLPKTAAFHAAGDDERLSGHVAGEGVGREKNGSVSDVVRSSNLWEGHGSSDFFDHCSVSQLGLISRNDGPARANAVEPSTAIIACVRSEAGDFVFQ